MSEISGSQKMYETCRSQHHQIIHNTKHKNGMVHAQLVLRRPSPHRGSSSISTQKPAARSGSKRKEQQTNESDRRERMEDGAYVARFDMAMAAAAQEEGRQERILGRSVAGGRDVDEQVCSCHTKKEPFFYITSCSGRLNRFILHINFVISKAGGCLIRAPL
jgi:hypothetical protein